MIGRIIEIAEDKRHLSAKRGFMIVHNTEDERQELARIPLDDIAAIIANAHGLSYTNNILVALAKQGAAFVLCGQNHNPVGILWPVDGHHLQAKRMDAQINAKKPIKKQLWASVVKAKVLAQANTLDALALPNIQLTKMVGKIKSGDPQNIEAQAARIYWKHLFGKAFIRDQNQQGINALLNYGYIVLRAATARAVIAAGLHPTLGIHHSNAGNPMRLVDDLMEPFRPIIDLSVHQLQQEYGTDINTHAKHTLASVLYSDMHTQTGTTPVMGCIQKLATSLAQVYSGERNTLNFPSM